MIEFDVLPEDQHDARRRAALLLAHDYEHVDRRAPTLEEGLAHLASSPFDGVELDVDLKLPGYEERVVDGAARARPGRAHAVSSNWMRSLVVAARARAAAAARLVGPARASATRRRSWLTKLPAYAGAALRARAAAAARRRRTWRAGRCDALMAHWRLVTPRAGARRRARPAASSTSGPSTTRARIGRLEQLGVTGVITNDPRLFAQLPSAQVAAE